ncbi:hypothetical protein ACLOJK_036674 [Asimina triloba]
MRMVGTVAARLWTLDRWAIDAGQRRMVLNVGWGVAGSWDHDGAVADGDGFVVFDGLLMESNGENGRRWCDGRGCCTPAADGFVGRHWLRMAGG